MGPKRPDWRERMTAAEGAGGPGGRPSRAGDRDCARRRRGALGLVRRDDRADAALLGAGAHAARPRRRRRAQRRRRHPRPGERIRTTSRPSRARTRAPAARFVSGRAARRARGARRDRADSRTPRPHPGRPRVPGSHAGRPRATCCAAGPRSSGPRPAQRWGPATRSRPGAPLQDYREIARRYIVAPDSLRAAARRHRDRAARLDRGRAAGARSAAHRRQFLNLVERRFFDGNQLAPGGSQLRGPGWRSAGRRLGRPRRRHPRRDQSRPLRRDRCWAWRSRAPTPAPASGSST